MSKLTQEQELAKLRQENAEMKAREEARNGAVSTIAKANKKDWLYVNCPKIAKATGRKSGFNFNNIPMEVFEIMFLDAETNQMVTAYLKSRR